MELLATKKFSALIVYARSFLCTGKNAASGFVFAWRQLELCVLRQRYLHDQ